MSNKVKSIEEKQQQKRDEDNARMLSKARSILRKSLEDEPVDDEQDRHVEHTREALIYANLYLGALDRQALSKVNYRIAVKLDNKQGIDGAETSMRDAVRDEEVAIPELERLLPLVPLGLIQSGITAEWTRIMLLPKHFRNMIGTSVLKADNIKADDIPEVI